MVRTPICDLFGIEYPILLDMSTKQATHEQRVVTYILAELTLALNRVLQLVRLVKIRTQHFHHAIKMPTFRRSYTIQVICVCKRRQNTGDIVGNDGIVQAQFVEALLSTL